MNLNLMSTSAAICKQPPGVCNALNHANTAEKVSAFRFTREKLPAGRLPVSKGRRFVLSRENPHLPHVWSRRRGSGGPNTLFRMRKVLFIAFKLRSAEDSCAFLVAPSSLSRSLAYKASLVQLQRVAINHFQEDLSMSTVVPSL